jgi:hypothetical protein
MICIASVDNKYSIFMQYLHAYDGSGIEFSLVSENGLDNLNTEICFTGSRRT